MSIHFGETGGILVLRQLGITAVKEQLCTNPLSSSLQKKTVVTFIGF
jgi:hypothetical protein